MASALFLGGTRSGKSACAEKWAAKIARQRETSVIYVATAEAIDSEFDERILRHQARRPSDWETQNIPYNLEEWLIKVETNKVILVDCLSMLVNNWIYHEGTPSNHFEHRLDTLVEALHCRTDLCIGMVTSEVGLGIVPEERETRYYRDTLGLVNAAVAAACDTAYLVLAGLPIDLRKWADAW